MSELLPHDGWITCDRGSDWNRYKRDDTEEEMNFGVFWLVLSSFDSAAGGLAEEADEEEWLDDDELMFRKYIKVASGCRVHS